MADLKLSLTDRQLADVIQEQVAAAVQSGLVANSDTLVTAFVKEALTVKDRYSSESPLIIHAKKLVQEVAKEELTKWVQKHRADIRKKMVAAIETGKFSDAIVDAILDATKKNLYVSISANISSSD